MKFKIIESQEKTFESLTNNYSDLIKESLSQLNNLRKYQTGYIVEAHNNTKYVISDVLDKFISEQGINLKGTKINNIEDLAVLSKIFRDTRYEIFRIIFVDGNTIVGSDAFSCKLPNTASTLFPSKTITNPKQLEDRTFGIYKAKMERLNANGYYLLHNHPSGNINPSNEDFYTTKGYISNLPGFKGHIILGKEEYGIINPDLSFEIDLLDDTPMKHTEILKDVYSIASYIEKHDINIDNNALIIYCTNGLEVIAVEEAELTAFNDNNFIKYIQNQSKQCGAVGKFIVTDNKEIAEKCSEYIYNRYITDVIFIDYNTVYSMREINKLPINEVPNKILKTYRVKEK